MLIIQEVTIEPTKVLQHMQTNIITFMPSTFTMYILKFQSSYLETFSYIT